MPQAPRILLKNSNQKTARSLFALALLGTPALTTSASAQAQPAKQAATLRPEEFAAVGGIRPNMPETVMRTLRYQPTPEGGFLVRDGTLTFNRPLYGGGTAFRIDAGDRPLFGLYLPGRGGILRLGWRRPGSTESCWAEQAASTVAVYHNGGYTYTLSDPSLAGATLVLEATAPRDKEALQVRARLEGGSLPLELVWSFGGADCKRGKRDADLGTEGMPLSQWWAFRPAHAEGNTVTTEGSTFTLAAKTSRLQGMVQGVTASHGIAAATDWDLSPALLADKASLATSGAPLVVGKATLTAEKTLELQLVRTPVAASKPQELAIYQDVTTDPSAKDRDAKAGDSAAAARLPEALQVSTPDPLLDASVAALVTAGDGVWDEPSGTVQHGAVAWRSKLLGWRGPYLNDALGWHARARSHIDYWAGRQNQQPIPEKLPAPDAKDNLSRNEPALHTNGDMSGTHYDMNLVYVDALFRHLKWTGDLDLARRLWPLLERHFAWEDRLFQRPYGPKGLPLYEAYCCIWASDDLWYSGGGATHSTAYNNWHRQQAAHLAPLIGADPEPHENQAGRIEKALERELWLKPEGRYAESREWLGSRLPRTHPALWTFYHAMDSDTATPQMAWQMTRYIDTELAHFPLCGPGLVDDGAFTVATTNWHPYAWSTNNVVMSEVAHTALGYWQAGRRDQAWRLLKGALLDSMWTGQCPGNAGMTTGFDVYRREAQRDFADSVGTAARAIVEGLFGVRPDALAGELTLSPGLPADWEHASLKHPSVALGFVRQGTSETWTVTPNFRTPQRLRFHLPALLDNIRAVQVDGVEVKWKLLLGSVGEPRIEVLCPATQPGQTRTLVIHWQGNRPVSVPAEIDAGEAPEGSWDDTESAPLPTGALRTIAHDFRPASILAVEDPQGGLTDININAGRLLAAPAPVPGRVIAFSDKPVAHRTAFVTLRQGALTWKAPLAYAVKVNKASPSSPAEIWETALPAGTIADPVDLSAHYNRKLTALFTEEYLTPRSPFASLAIPRHGYGSWCTPMKTFALDDAGLRALANAETHPLGIPLALPKEEGAPNAAMTSLWDNHPRELVIPLNGKARRIVVLLTGTSTSMQSRLDTAELVATYEDGGTVRLPLRNPDNWWPIDQDLLTDAYAFSRPATLFPRLELASGRVRLPSAYKPTGKPEAGGLASYLDLCVDPSRPLRSLTVKPLANEAIVALLAVTLVR